MGKTYTTQQFVDIKVSADCPNRTRSDIAAGRHKVVIDEPPARHGNDEGMLPLQALIASLASCSHVVASVTAREIGFNFIDSKIEVSGRFDTRCFTGDAQVTPLFTDITITVHARCDAGAEQFEDFKQQLRWRCPVFATFLAASTKIHENWLLDTPGAA
jgi:uncharacterized OsmC-like protein